MLKANYGIPVLEDNDIADLNKYSLEMADALKTQLDKFGNPLSYKGQVDTIQDLPSDTQSGDIYSVTSENKNYIWNGTVWVEYASTIDVTELENKTIVDKTTISGKTSQEGTPSPTNIVPIKNVNVYGKNELKIPDYEFYSYGITTKVNNGKISTKGKTTDTYFYLSDFIDCNIPAGDYIFSLDKTFNFQIEVAIKYSDDTRGDFRFSNARSAKATFTKDVKAYRIAFSWLVSGTNIDYNFSAKIEKDRGIDATAYTPYSYGFLDLNLQKDTDTKTVTLISKRLHEDDRVDEWGFNYNRNTYTITGNETIDISQTHTNSTLFRITASTNYLSKTDYILGICSHLKFSMIWGHDKEGIYTTAKYIYLSINNSTIGGNTVEKFKTWLVNQYANGTPVTIEYELAEQENEQFNEENQTAWNTLENLLLQGYTFINTSSDELQPTVTLTEHTANEIHRENVEKFKEIDNRDVYSTEEQVIGKWIDGKPIYRKVVTYKNTEQIGETGKIIYIHINHLIDNLEQCINIVGFSSAYRLPFINGQTSLTSSTLIEGVTYEKINLKIINDSWGANRTWTFILEYTKTTD